MFLLQEDGEQCPWSAWPLLAANKGLLISMYPCKGSCFPHGNHKCSMHPHAGSPIHVDAPNLTSALVHVHELTLSHISETLPRKKCSIMFSKWNHWTFWLEWCYWFPLLSNNKKNFSYTIKCRKGHVWTWASVLVLSLCVQAMKWMSDTVLLYKCLYIECRFEKHLHYLGLLGFTFSVLFYNLVSHTLSLFISSTFLVP